MSVQHKDLSGDELHQPMPIGNDVDKSATPVSGDWYLATDTGKLYVCFSDGTWEEFGVDSSALQDADADTKVEVEQSADEDKVRVTTAGTQRAVIDSNGLALENGGAVNEFSTDGTLAGNSDLAVPTEKAVKTYCDNLDTSPANGSISTAKLKTASGQVSSSSGAVIAMPGGTYGFYPQTRSSTGSSTAGRITMGGTSLNGNGQINSSYGTWIAFIPNGCTLYAQQLYVTASGQDYWVFVLADKTTGEIVSTYCAPDHPCYGNGGDVEQTPHPFGDFDQDKYFVAILDKASVEKVRYEKNPAELLLDNFKINADGVYEPIHSGRFLDQDPELIMELPAGIQVKTIKSYTKAEKETRRLRQESLRQEAEDRESIMKKIDEQKHKSAVLALKAEGVLSLDYEDEITRK